MCISHKVLKLFLNKKLLISHSTSIIEIESHLELKSCHYCFYGASYLDAKMLR